MKNKEERTKRRTPTKNQEAIKTQVTATKKKKKNQ